MKYYTFYRESNNFTDILKDTSLKKYVTEKIQWNNFLMIGINEYKHKDVDQIYSYITLKYGDEIRNQLVKDRSPVPYVDYVPIRN